jgi:hypothetical protein
LEVARDKISPVLDELANGDHVLKRELSAIFAMMQLRKQMHYPHDRRFIVDFSLTDNDEGMYLQVASTPLAV